MTAGYHVLNGIPLDYQYELHTEGSDYSNYPQQILIPYNIQNPIAIYFLIQADWGWSDMTGEQVGTISFNFNTTQSYAYQLVLGSNLRDWSRDGSPLVEQTITSPDISSAWTGTSPDGRAGGMDLLKVTLPFPFPQETIQTINIKDATLTNNVPE